jgi:plasmid maintenance system antidote protein VapI
MASKKTKNIDEANVLATEALTSLLNVVESIRQAGAETLNALMAMHKPITEETIKLSMMLQASIGFSIALQQWIELISDRQEELEKLEKELKAQGN